MIELVFAASDVDSIRQELIGGEVEGCAVLYANQISRDDGTVKLLVREVDFPAPGDYSRRGPIEAELTPACVARVTKRAARNNSALVFVHSHPGVETPIFSMVDDLGEVHLAKFLGNRHPNLTHAALVVSAGGMCGRQLGTKEPIRVVSIGTSRDVLFDPGVRAPSDSEIFDRQVRAFGSAGQHALERVRIAIVGLGGIGSVVAQQLVHLGVREFILVDADILESTNLNRVANATPADIGQSKVDIAARYIRSVSQDATVNCVSGDVTLARTARKLLGADVIFGCTDSHGSRAVLQQIAYQYLIPCVDTGTTIAVKTGHITHIYGRAQLLSPGLACFTCSGLLDASEVRRDMMTPFERQADPYLQGVREPAPAVMSLNSTVASLAVTMVLSMICGVPVPARYLLYNAMSSSIRTVRANPDPNCYICSRAGSLARGDSWPLLARQD